MRDAGRQTGVTQAQKHNFLYAHELKTLLQVIYCLDEREDKDDEQTRTKYMRGGGRQTGVTQDQEHCNS